MNLKFVLVGALIAGLATPAVSVGANDTYYVAHDMQAKKCSVVKNNPTTGKVGSGQTYESEAPRRRWTKWRSARGNNPWQQSASEHCA
jgi:hypothetical protein